jgi:hypothetical protein
MTKRNVAVGSRWGIDGTSRSPRMSIAFDQEDFRRLQTLAEDEGLTVSWLVRQAVNEFLGKRKPSEG